MPCSAMRGSRAAGGGRRESRARRRWRRALPRRRAFGGEDIWPRGPGARARRGGARGGLLYPMVADQVRNSVRHRLEHAAQSHRQLHWSDYRGRNVLIAVRKRIFHKAPQGLTHGNWADGTVAFLESCERRGSELRGEVRRQATEGNVSASFARERPRPRCVSVVGRRSSSFRYVKESTMPPAADAGGVRSTGTVIFSAENGRWSGNAIEECRRRKCSSSTDVTACGYLAGSARLRRW